MPFSINPSFTTKYHHSSYPRIDPNRPQNRLSGKTALVTGGGKGIGRAIANSLASAGVSAITIVGRTEDALASTKRELAAKYPDLKIFSYLVDISKHDEVISVFQKIKSDVRSVDILVSNAGYLPDYGLIESACVKEWWKGFEVNLLGYFNVVQAYLQFLSPKGLCSPPQTGKVININSAAGHLRYDGMSSYSGAKNAALWFTDSICEEYPQVFAASIHPGVCATDMNAKNNGVPEEDINLPADLVVWLASPEAAFMRGRMMWSSWDVEELMERKQEILDRNLLKMTLRGYPISKGLGYSTES